MCICIYMCRLSQSRAPPAVLPLLRRATMDDGGGGGAAAPLPRPCACWPPAPCAPVCAKRGATAAAAR